MWLLFRKLKITYFYWMTLVYTESQSTLLWMRLPSQALVTGDLFTVLWVSFLHKRRSPRRGLEWKDSWAELWSSLECGTSGGSGGVRFGNRSFGPILFWNGNCNFQINNAGCMVNKRKLTEDGLEKNFATNTLGMYMQLSYLFSAK